MHSVMASPEFETEAQVDLWTRKQKAAEPLYDIMRMLIKKCDQSGISIEDGSKDLVELGRQVIQEVDGKLFQVVGGTNAETENTS